MKTNQNIQHCDGIEILQQELTRRISNNPKYSLRAFARFLQVSPATLSLILARKLQLSKKSVEKIAHTLLLEPHQLDSLRAQTFAKKKQQNKKRLVEPNSTMEIFTILSEWYHFAILSLLEISPSSVESRWIAKKLGITVTEAKLAVERLKKLNLIGEVSGRYKQIAAPMRIGNILSNAAARKFQRQLLEKALYSLENDPSQNRDISSMTFAMNSKDLNYASEKITEFRRQLTEELENRKKPNAVYTLTIQLFPVTKEPK